jgi:hypothetical protein
MYLQKYLKYKSKYLRLLKQIQVGGNLTLEDINKFLQTPLPIDDTKVPINSVYVENNSNENYYKGLHRCIIFKKIDHRKYDELKYFIFDDIGKIFNDNYYKLIDANNLIIENIKEIFTKNNIYTIEDMQYEEYMNNDIPLIERQKTILKDREETIIESIGFKYIYTYDNYEDWKIKLISDTQIAVEIKFDPVKIVPFDADNIIVANQISIDTLNSNYNTFYNLNPNLNDLYALQDEIRQYLFNSRKPIDDYYLDKINFFHNKCKELQSNPLLKLKLDNYFYVFRGVSYYDHFRTNEHFNTMDKLEMSMPFSATTKFDIASQWIANPKIGLIYVIKIKPNTPYMILKNQRQFEITIGSGTLIYKTRHYYNERWIIQCDFEPEFPYI